MINNILTRLLLLSLFMTLFSFGYSQKKITTEDGKKIIILPDGSWKYDESKEESKDLELVRLVSDANTDVNAYELPVDDNSEISEINLEKIALLEHDLSNLITKLSAEYKMSKDNLKLLKEELKIAEKLDDVVESADIQTEINRVEELESNLKDQINRLNDCQSDIKKARKSKDKKASAIIKTVNQKIKTEFNLGFDDKTIEIEDISNFHFELMEEDKKPIIDCDIRFDGMDTKLKKYRKETESKALFSYTHPKLKSFFKSKDFLNCKANILKLGAYNYLGFEINIASKDAKKNYGAIERNAMLRITFINGDDLHLMSINDDRGTIQPYTGNTLYKVRYLIDKDQMKELEKNEIDKIGLIWTTGFEEYEIYEVDFFMNQLNCLNSKSK